MRARAAFLLLALTLTGCAAVRLRRIEAYTNGTFPRRDPALHAAWDASGAPNDGFVPDDDDEIALWLIDGSGTRQPLDVKHNGLLYLQDVDTARLTVRLLRALLAFEIVSPSNGTAAVTTQAGDYADWSTLRQKLEAVSVDCGGAGMCRLHASLEPRERVFVVPGEEVTIERTYLDECVPCERPPFLIVDSIATTVDPAGWIDVPPVAPLAASVSPDIANRGDGLIGGMRRPAFRLAGAEIAALYGRVRAWSPATLHSLGEIASCLSVATLLPGDTGCSARPDAEAAEMPLPPDFVARCLDAGVDRQFATCPGKTAINVHYRLTARLFWTLVDERGERIAVPYRHGVTVEDAVRREYLRVRGRELVVPGVFGGTAYLSVLPDPRTGEVRRFYLKVQYGQQQSDALLLPNDVVFVSRSWPERLRPGRNGGY